MFFRHKALWWIASSSFLTMCVNAGTEAEIIAALDEAAEEGTWGYVPLSGPYIDKNMSRNVTGQKGKTAVLSCRILYIVGKTVSWIRERDLHLLTVGRFTYTSDDRYRAVHQQGSDDWLLKIHYLQDRDRGAYECQVSTTPPITHTIFLEVLDPTTRIVGGPDLYINIGSKINLTCEVRFSPEPPPYIFWYHNDRLLSYDMDQSGTTVTTEHAEESSVSRLIIEKAMTSHSGQYNCSPATAPSHFINVHVIPTKDEEPAAIHHKNTTSSSSSTSASNVAPIDADGKVTKNKNSSSSSLQLPLTPAKSDAKSTYNSYHSTFKVFIPTLMTMFWSNSAFLIRLIILPICQST